MANTNAQSAGAKKKKQGVSWPEQSVNTIVAYVDSVKGDDSPFLRNNKAECESLVAQIIDDFAPGAPLTGKNIRDKFGHVWQKCRLSSVGIEEFWKQGVDALDMDKFEKSMLGSSSYHGLSDISEDEKEEVDGDADDESEGDAEVEVEVEAETSMKITTANPRKRPRLEASKAERAQLLQGAQVVANAKDDIRGSTSQEQWGSDNLPSYAPVTNVQDAIAVLRTSAVRDDHQLAVRAVEADARTLYRHIKTATEEVLAAMGLPKHQPPALDTGVFFSPEIASLLAVLMGTTGEDWKETRGYLDQSLSSVTADQLSLNIFVQSLLGAAVQEWVCKLQDFELGHAVAQDVLETRMGAHAKTLAIKFDQQVSQVLPNRRGSAFMADPSLGLFGPVYPKAPEPKILAQSYFYRSEPLPLGEGVARPVVNLEWHTTWMKRLEGIFCLALQFRFNMSYAEDYAGFQFEFPAYLDSYKGEPSRVYDRVLLGLLPTIKVVPFTKDEDGAFILGDDGAKVPRVGDPDVLFEGIFHAGFLGPIAARSLFD